MLGRDSNSLGQGLEAFPEGLYIGRDYSSFAKTRNLLGRCSNSLGPGPWGLWGFAIGLPGYGY